MFNFIIILSVLFSSTSQLLLKKGAITLNMPKELTIDSLFSVFVSLCTNLYLVAGVLFQVIALLIWVYVLKKVDVSYAYPFISLGFIFVVIMGYQLYGESINTVKLLGCLTICTGVFILSRS